MIGAFFGGELLYKKEVEQVLSQQFDEMTKALTEQQRQAFGPVIKAFRDLSLDAAAGKRDPGDLQRATQELTKVAQNPSNDYSTKEAEITLPQGKTILVCDKSKGRASVTTLAVEGEKLAVQAVCPDRTR